MPLLVVARDLGIRTAGSKTRCTLRTTVVHIIFDLGYSLGHSEKLENPKITSWIACLGEVLNQNDNGITTQQTINRVTGTIAYRIWSSETVNLVNYRDDSTTKFLVPVVPAARLKDGLIQQPTSLSYF